MLSSKFKVPRPRQAKRGGQNSILRKDPILARINRIEGQIQGIKKMYEKNRMCVEIVQQVQASRAALGKLAGVLLSDEAKRCADAGNLKELEKIVEKTFKTV